VFIQIIQGRCKDPEAMREMSERWRRDLAPGATGWLGGTYGITDDGMFVGVVRFESREAAMANSARPEQGEWWAEMQKMFDGPVEFHDCDDVTLLLDGGSDDAGFVQVIRGKVDDPERLRSMMTQDADLLHEARPEIIGGTLAIEEDGTFTETIAFTDEVSARKGEQMDMPEDVREQMESMLRDAQYLDLHKPWFSTSA
jgi:hypothetical protein